MKVNKILASAAVLASLMITGCFSEKGINKGVTEEQTNIEQTEARAIASTYPTMFLRGTNNNWGTTPMVLTNSNEWTALGVTFGKTNLERFKFDVKGKWETNFGDTNKDGTADMGGADIGVTSGKTYDITFNDSTKKYTVKESAVIKCDVTVGFTTDSAVTLAGLNVKVSKDAILIAQTTVSALNVATFSALSAGNYKLSVDQMANGYPIKGEANLTVAATDKSLKATINLTKIISGSANLAVNVTGTTLGAFLAVQKADANVIKVYKDSTLITAEKAITSTGALTITKLVEGNYKAVVDYDNNGKKYAGETSFAITKTATTFGGILNVTYTETKIFAKTYATMKYRGTSNGWGTTPMTLIADNLWSIKGVVTGKTATERFKVDAYGDWKTNFGLNGISYGKDIPLEANSTYNITFNDKTRVFTVTKWITALTITTTKSSIKKGDTTFKLPAIGSYSKDGTTTQVALTWTPALDTNKVGETTYTAITSGTSVTYKLTVTDGFASSYPTVFFRGTPNNWGSVKMTLTADNTWSIKDIKTAATTPGAFKIDIYGDWKVNFGLDGVSFGKNIPLDANATYDITFNDITKKATATKK